MVGIHGVDEIEERVDVEVAKGAVWCEGAVGVANIEFWIFGIVREPDVCFDAFTTVVKRFVERYATPVIVVGMALERPDISCHFYRIVCNNTADVIDFSPVWGIPASFS